jgi:hypothetical protein
MTPAPTFSAGPYTPPTTARQPLSQRHHVLALEKERVHHEFACLDKGLVDGLISREEYRYYLQQRFGGKLEHEVMRDLEQTMLPVPQEKKSNNAIAVVALLVVMLFGFAGILLFAPQQAPLTGYISAPVETMHQHLGNQFTESGNYTLNVTGTEMVAITGSLERGDASISLLLDGERLHVYSGSTPVYWVTTDKQSVARNGTINISLIPEEASATFWLENELGQRIVVPESFILDEPGTFVLDALINDSGNITIASTSFTVRNETNQSNDILREEDYPVTTFTEACDESCQFNNSGNKTLQLEIILDEGARLTLEDIAITQGRTNEAPTQLLSIPDQTLDVGETIEVLLTPYFVDSDGDTLTYDFLDAAGVTMELEGARLTMTGVTPGSDESIVYASDLYSLVQSNRFSITVLPSQTPESNGSINQTGDENESIELVNETADTPMPESSSDCSNPDPNLRPLECLQDDPAKYFQEQEIMISDTSRVPIARLTNIGNLLLTGDVIENAQFSGNTQDYVVGYEDAYGNFIVTIWFDSESGNLYLKGSLLEEQANQVPPPGSYAFRNRKGITLAWASQNAGDLYLRGNLIPYRRSIE